MNARAASLQDAALVNPITMAFDLAAGFRDLLVDTLREGGLSGDDVEHVVDRMQDIGVDNRLLFSINRKYAASEESFETFCRRCLSEQLLEAVHQSAAEGKRIERLYGHQAKGIESIVNGVDTVVATGTGSGKTETFLFPILDHCLKNPGDGVKALIIYPMNALANDQLRRLGDLVGAARDASATLRYGSFTGQTPRNAADTSRTNPPAYPLSEGHVLYRDDIRRDPPDILITNYVMLDRMLTSTGADGDRSIVEASADTLRYVVLDELHTYTGNNATHLRGLLRRLRHPLHHRPVFVGTSATLTSRSAASQETDGYLSQTPKEEADAFIKPLLDTEDFQIVTPDYAPLVPPGEVTAISLVNDVDALGWELQINESRGLDNLSRLLGRSFIEEDLDPEDGEPPLASQALRRDAFVVELTQRLYHGPLTFAEVVDVLQTCAPQGTSDLPALAKAYLSAIAFVNQMGKGEAVLDFHMHLFLKDIGGHLKTCIRCRHYHSGMQSECGTCGWPLYRVHKHDVQEALGKVSDRELRPTLMPQEGESNLTYLVRISHRGDAGPDLEAEPDLLRFDDAATPTRQGIPLSHASGGPLRLRLVPRGGYERSGDLTVPLVKARKTYQYLVHVVETLLRSQHTNDRKLLAFVDNREKASRYESILRDGFASSFYEDLLGLYHAEIQMRDLPDALSFIVQAWEEVGGSGAEADLQEDFPAWVSRAISRSPRKGMDGQQGGLFQLQSPASTPGALDALTDLQREIVDLFFNERAIDKRFLIDRVPDLAPGAELTRKRHVLRAQRNLIGQHHGVHLGSAPTTKQFSAISLGSQSRTYKEFIEQHGDEAVAEAVQSLVDDGSSPRLPLVAAPVPGGEEGAQHVYLKPSWVRFSARDTGCSTYAEVRQRLLSGGLHSSDVLDAAKADAETRFQDGALDVLVATPTLEMGVDIGQLKSVLHIGVPPLPSNYAQRAGRAGRGRSDRYALITTFCSERSSHDRYYFDRPREIVAGVISPPGFDPDNEDVLRKHVHALVLRDWASDADAFRGLVARADAFLPPLATEADEVFGDAFDAAAYVLGPMKKALDEWSTMLTKARPGRSPRDLFYDVNVFPDYGFRRDEVVVIDKRAAAEAKEDLKGAAQRFQDGVLDRRDQAMLDRHRISGRSPERAYKRLFPGETVSMAGDDFGIGSSSPFYSRIGPEGSVRSYQVLYGHRSDDLDAGGTFQMQEPVEWLSPDPASTMTHLEGLVQITHHPACVLSFRTLEEAPSGTSNPDEREPLTMGYDLEREALSFSFPRELVSDNRLALSFLSAFDRAVKNVYGLGEGDLSLIADIPMATGTETQATDAAEPDDPALDKQDPAAPPPDSTLHAVLYDSSGNGNAPLARVAAELLSPDGTLRWSLRRLTDCPNKECTSGCYLCVRSYSTHHSAGEVDRAAARMVVGYLLGENPFEPALPLPPDPGACTASTVLSIGLKDGVATAHDGNQPLASFDTSQGQNDALYAAISEGAAAAFSEGSGGLRIVVEPGVGYLTDLINNVRVGNNAKRPEKEAFERMLFSVLRYPSLQAVDHASL